MHPALRRRADNRSCRVRSLTRQAGAGGTETILLAVSVGVPIRCRGSMERSPWCEWKRAWHGPTRRRPQPGHFCRARGLTLGRLTHPDCPSSGECFGSAVEDFSQLWASRTWNVARRATSIRHLFLARHLHHQGEPITIGLGDLPQADGNPNLARLFRDRLPIISVGERFGSRQIFRDARSVPTGTTGRLQLTHRLRTEGTPSIYSEGGASLLPGHHRA